MFRNKTVLLFASVALTIMAIAIVALINKTSSTTGSTTDVRARASSVNTLQFNATVDSIDAASGTVIVNDMYMADTSRAGEAKNLGTWTVTPPFNVNTAVLTPGAKVVIGIDPKTFLAQSHSLTALTITVEKK